MQGRIPPNDGFALRLSAHSGAIRPTAPQKETQMDPFLAELEAIIARWHGIAPPNEPGRRMAADLVNTIAAFEALRGTLKFEDEPSSFEAALHDLREAG
jgi:hypothetical protein